MDRLKKLLQNGVDPNLRDYDERNTTHVARPQLPSLGTPSPPALAGAVGHQGGGALAVHACPRLPCGKHDGWGRAWSEGGRGAGCGARALQRSSTQWSSDARAALRPCGLLSSTHRCN